jgi:hypothetical protein
MFIIKNRNYIVNKEKLRLNYILLRQFNYFF